MGAIRLAFFHMLFHWKRTFLLIGCLTILILLPIAIRQIVSQLQTQLQSRALATPVVVGAKGSQLDLALHGLYFRGQNIETIPYGTWKQFLDKGYLSAVPIHNRFQSNGYPIVGTHLDYFQLRDLKTAKGNLYRRLGQCVLGSEVATRLNLKVGDKILSESNSYLSIAGSYPLKMNIVGILSPTGSPDDQAIFVDVKTAWVIENLGHGHQDLTQSDDPNLILEKNEKGIVAAPSVLPYTEITEKNISSFHFHGDTKDFPITAIVMLSKEQQENDLALGYSQDIDDIQGVQSEKEVNDLIEVVFQVQWLINLLVAVIGSATLCMFGLVVGLNVHIRKEEMQTMFKLGASRGLTFLLHFAEICMILLVAIVVAFGLAMFVQWLLTNQIQQWIV